MNKDYAEPTHSDFFKALESAKERRYRTRFAREVAAALALATLLSGYFGYLVAGYLA